MDTQQKKFVFFLILAVVVGMLVAGKLLSVISYQLPVISNKQELQKIKIGQAEVGVEVAVTAEQKSQGLAGRGSLGENEGMMFVFDQPGQYGFWMKGMRFPLDFVWVRSGKVVEVTENVPVSNEDAPKVYQPQQPIEAMLEVNAGWVRRHKVKVGDELVVE